MCSTTIQEQLEAGQSNISQRKLFEAEVARFAAELLAVRGEQAGAQAELERAIGKPVTNLRLDSARLPVAAWYAGAGRLSPRADRVFAGLLSPNVPPPRRACQSLAPMQSFRNSRRALSQITRSRNDESGVGLTIAGRIPIWDRNQGEIVRARGVLDAADRELESFDRVEPRAIGGRRVASSCINLQARASAYRDQVIPPIAPPMMRLSPSSAPVRRRRSSFSKCNGASLRRRRNLFEYAVEALSARTHLEQLIGGRIEEVGAASSTRST